jgi:hypothetical protein
MMPALVPWLGTRLFAGGRRHGQGPLKQSVRLQRRIDRLQECCPLMPLVVREQVPDTDGWVTSALTRQSRD